MTTLTKLLEPHARPAQVLLKRAKPLTLTSAQRLALPAHLDAGGAHLHHALDGHRPIEVGDVLLDESGGLWLVHAERETVWRVTGPADALLAFAYALGQQHERAMVLDGALAVLPNDGLQARIETSGLRFENVDAAFAPTALVAHRHESAHDHDHDHGHAHHEGCGHDHHHHHHE